MLRRLLAAPCLPSPHPRPPHKAFRPNPSRLIVPWPPGGLDRHCMRALAEATQKHLGQPIVVENRPGAGGTLGATALLKAPGPTATRSRRSRSACSACRTCSRRPITRSRTSATSSASPATRSGVVVRSDAPWTTWGELIAFRQSQSGQGELRHPRGRNTSLHITMEEVGYAQGIKWTHVPFKGNAENMAALARRPHQRRRRLDRMGSACRCREDAPARNLGRAAHPALAERADAQGARLRRRLELALWHCRTEGHGPRRSSGSSTTRSRRAWKIRFTCRRSRSSTRSWSTCRARTTPRFARDTFKRREGDPWKRLKAQMK